MIFPSKSIRNCYTLAGSLPALAGGETGQAGRIPGGFWGRNTMPSQLLCLHPMVVCRHTLGSLQRGSTSHPHLYHGAVSAALADYLFLMQISHLCSRLYCQPKCRAYVAGEMSTCSEPSPQRRQWSKPKIGAGITGLLEGWKSICPRSHGA